MWHFAINLAKQMNACSGNFLWVSVWTTGGYLKYVQNEVIGFKIIPHKLGRFILQNEWKKNYNLDENASQVQLDVDSAKIRFHH
jgi:uncharacterized protein (DUF362 family)